MKPEQEWARSRAARDGVELFEAAFQRFAYDRHFHDAYAIGVTRSGVQRFWCGGATYDGVRGDILLIPPGEVHDGESGTAEGYSYRMFYVPERVLRDIAVDAFEGRVAGIPVRRVPLLRDPVVADRLNAAWVSACTDPMSLRADELFGAACARLMSGSDFRQTDDFKPDRAPLVRIRDFLASNVGRNVRMQELAALAGMSRFRLTRQFQRQFGLPLHAYHIQLRLGEAKRRLAAGEPISAVALSLGFVDQSHLTRRFRAAFGLPPGSWRRDIGDGAQGAHARLRLA